MTGRWFAALATFVLALIAGPISAVAQNAYITNGGASTVSVIATANNTVIGSPIQVGNTPYGVAITPDGSKVYIANSGTNTVSVIATASNTVTATITVGANPVGLAMAADGSEVYVANQGASTVSVIATASNTVTGTITVGNSPSGIVAAPDGSKVYVANTGDSTVSLILTSLNTATAAIPVGTGPVGLAVTPDGSKLYVANQIGNSVSVIATAATSVATTIIVGLGPIGVAASPDGSVIYVANSISNSVSVISTANNTVTASVAVGTTPVGIAVTPDGSKVFVANQGANTVSAIATASKTLIGSPISVGSAPAALGMFITPVRSTPGLSVTPTAYATQAVAAATGALTIPGGATFVSPVFTTGSAGGTATITFTLPTGVTFAALPTATADGAAFTSATVSGGSGTNSVSFDIALGANLLFKQGTLILSGFQVAAATALTTPTTTGFTIGSQLSGSSGATPSLNQAIPGTTSLATSANALSFNATASPAATINVLSPDFATKVSQPVPIGTTSATRADLGTLSTTLGAGLQNAAATGQFTFAAATLTVTITGNLTGMTGAYVAPPGTLSCATTYAGRPSGAADGALSANLITFAGVGAGFNTPGAGPQLQEVCVYFNGTTVIGQNPAGFAVTGSVDTTTQTATSPLAIELYNGIVQPIAYSSSNASNPMYIRIVNNNNISSVPVFAIVQSDRGAIGQAQVESALPANSNDLVTVSSIMSAAGVSSANNLASIILLAPSGITLSQLSLNPGGTFVQLGAGASR